MERSTCRIDNDYIAAKVVRGDANGDGIVNGNGTGPAASDDVRFFVNHYLDQQIVTDLDGVERVVGDITSVTTMADFNGSGTTDILDWYILTQEHVRRPRDCRRKFGCSFWLAATCLNQRPSRSAC